MNKELEANTNLSLTASFPESVRAEWARFFGEESSPTLTLGGEVGTLNDSK